MKHILFIFLSFSILFNIQAQEYYYYYNGEKQHLSLDTRHAFISIEKDKEINNLKRIDISKNSFTPYQIDESELKNQKNNRLWSEISFPEQLSEKEYITKLSELKKENPDIIISPYFKMENSEKIGLSDLFYVKLKTSADSLLLLKKAEETNTLIVEQDGFMPLWYVLRITAETNQNALETANLFYESNLFSAAEPNLMPANMLYCSNDSLFNNQWGLRNTGQFGGISGNDINICEAWEISTGQGTIVAVLDHGIDLTHPDLINNIHPVSFDTQNRTQGSVLRGDHGTACAGIIGAMRNNTSGIAGVAPDCRLMSISSSLNLQTVNIQQNLAAGINFAWENGAHVISNSWGNPALRSTFINDAINNAVTRGRNGLGCVVVFASGNDNSSSVSYPAELANVIAVGAMAPDGKRKSPSTCDGETRWGSNYGTNLNVIAPGVLISTTDVQGRGGYNPNSNLHAERGGTRVRNDYTNQDYTIWFTGTSSACPFVAGLAALMLSIRPDLTHTQVRNAIESTCDKPSGYIYSSRPNGPFHNEVGYGKINAYKALASITPWKVSGPTLVCRTGNTFTVNSSSGVSWRCSSNLQVSSSSGNSAVIKSTRDGLGWIQAVVNGIPSAKYEVWSGGPVITNVVGPSRAETGQYARFEAIVGNTLSSTITSYQWILNPVNGNNLYGANTRFLDIAFYNPGNYQVVVQACNSCGWGEYYVTGLNVVRPGGYSFSLYPNPVSNVLNITVSTEQTASILSNSQQLFSFRLFNLQGNMVRHVTGTSQKTEIDVSSLSNGIYFLHIYEGDSNTPEIHKVIVNH